METRTAGHRRIPMSKIEESPKDGFYVTKEDMQKMRLLSGIFLGLAGLSLLLPRKR